MKKKFQEEIAYYLKKTKKDSNSKIFNFKLKSIKNILYSALKIRKDI